MAYTGWSGIKNDTGGVGNMLRRIKEIVTRYAELGGSEDISQERTQSGMADGFTCKHHGMQQ